MTSDPQKPVVHTATPVGPANGMWFGVVALVLGVLACGLPLAPFDLTGVRPYIALAPGLPGIAIGLMGATGRVRGRALAVTGLVLCGFGLVMSAIMVLNSMN